MKKVCDSSGKIAASQPAEVNKMSAIAGPLFLLLGAALLTAGSLGFAHVIAVSTAVAILGVSLGGVSFLVGLYKTKQACTKQIPQEAVDALTKYRDFYVKKLDEKAARKALQQAGFTDIPTLGRVYSVMVNGQQLSVSKQHNSWVVENVNR